MTVILNSCPQFVHYFPTRNFKKFLFSKMSAFFHFFHCIVKNAYNYLSYTYEIELEINVNQE